MRWTASSGKAHLCAICVWLIFFCQPEQLALVPQGILEVDL
ncbi:hypothetical protein T4A_5275 [Trichinella pseudospiralis]|uniref:Uncharacterized protein n=1 Tax=Trichinella pseudospiralis TaxID=6337 RepID=A0A0V1DS87_TRIPS|nr:hypothetical protein T4A_5275 [Trichinella pseudospiralis]KRZ21541.1 hypothetical protein T4C_12813 [Trichinella pseudospiralis]